MNGASNIGWNESLPTENQPVGAVNAQFYSLKSAIRTGMDDEHNWPSSGGNGFGYHRYGTTRAYYGTHSQVSSDGTDGRLMVTSDSSLLFGMNSVAPFFLGGFGALSMISSAGSGFPQRHQWVMDSGTTYVLDTSVITFQGSGYSGIPTVILTCVAPGASIDTQLGVIMSITTRAVKVSGVTFGSGAGSPTTIHWFSVGSRAL